MIEKMPPHADKKSKQSLPLSKTVKHFNQNVFSLKKSYDFFYVGGAVLTAIWVMTAFFLTGKSSFDFTGHNGLLNLSMMLTPALLIMIGAVLLRRENQNTKNLSNPYDNFQNSSDFSEEIKEQIQNTHAVNFQNLQELNIAGKNIEERIQSILTSSTEVMEHLKKTVSDNQEGLYQHISDMSENNNEAIDNINKIVIDFANQQENVTHMSDMLVDLESKINNKFLLHSTDLSSLMDDKLEHIKNTFLCFKDDFDHQQKILLEDLKDKNTESGDIFQKLLDNQTQNIETLTNGLNDNQEKIIQSFSSNSDVVYVRLQNILKELTHNTDQLVMRIESRQIQVRETVSQQSEEILAVFSEHETNTIERINQATQNLSSLNENIETYLNTQNEKLDEVLLQSSENQETSNKKITLMLENTRKDFEKGLMDNNEQIHKNIQTSLSHHGEWLNQLANWLEHQNTQLHRHADEYGHIFEMTIGNATKNIRGFGAILEGQLSNIIGASDTAITRLRDAGKAFENTFLRLDQASALGVERAEKLEESLEKSSSLLEASTDRLVSSGDHMLNDLRKQSERLSEAVSFMKEEQKSALEGFIDDAESRLGNLRNLIDKQGEQISYRLEENFEHQASLINKAIDQNFTQFQRISDHIGETLIETSSQMINKLVMQGSDIETSMTKLLHRLVQSSASLDDGINNMHNAMENSDTRINDLKNLAQNQLSYFETLIHRIEQSSQRVKDNIASDQHDIIRILGETERQAIASSQEINHKSNSVSKKTKEAAHLLENIYYRMQQHLDLLAKVSEQAQNHVGTIDQRLNSQMHNLEANLSKQGKEIEDAFLPSLKHINSISQLISKQSVDMRENFDQSLQDINHAGTSFKEQTLQMNSLFHAATEHLDQAQNRLLKSTNDIKEIADDLEQRSENVEQIILNQTRLVEKSASNFEERLNGLTSHIALHLNSLQEAGKSFDKDFNETGTRFSNTARELKSILENTFYQLDKSNHLYEEGMQRLHRQLSQTHSFLETHQQQMGNNENALGHISSKTNDLFHALQNQFENLNGQFENTADKIIRNVSRIDNIFDDQRRGVGSVSSKLDKLRDDLQHQCREISHISGKALDIFSTLPATIAHQGNAIISQTSDIRDDAENLMTQIKGDMERINLQSESVRKNMSVLESSFTYSSSFMDDAQHIVEELHNTSRTLFENLFGLSNNYEEKFSLGTKNIYTRHLLKNNSGDFLRNLSKKFHNDDKLRKSILNYQDRFENLIEKARESDSGNTLPNAFISSDIGCLYLVLTRISGRNPISFDKPH